MKNTCWSSFLLLFALSLATHIPKITSPLLDHHSWAQTLRASLARNYFEGDMNLFHPRYDSFEVDDHQKAPQFPLYSYLAALLYEIFGPREWLGRVLSAFFAALSAGMLYLLALRFFDRRTALFCGLAFCFIPIRIYFMRTFMPESMAIASLVSGYYFFLRWLDEGRFFPDGVLAALLLMLAPLLKIPYFWLLLPLFFHGVAVKGRGFLKDPVALAIAAVVLLGLTGWYSYINRGYDRSSGFIRQLANEMSIFSQWADPRFWKVHFLSRFPELLTTYGGLAFFVAGFGKAWRERILFPLFWFAATVLYILLCGEYGRIHQYVSLPFAPVNALFIGLGMSLLLEKTRGRRPLPALWLLLALSVPVHAALRVRNWYRLDQAWVAKAKEEADKVSKPEDLFFVNSQNQPFYLYHLHRKGWAVHLEGRGLDLFEDALKQGAVFLFVPVHDTYMDWEALKPAMRKRFRLLYGDQDFEIYKLKP